MTGSLHKSKIIRFTYGMYHAQSQSLASIVIMILCAILHCVRLLESMKRKPMKPSVKCHGHGEGQDSPHQQIPHRVPLRSPNSRTVTRDFGHRPSARRVYRRPVSRTFKSEILNYSPACLSRSLHRLGLIIVLSPNTPMMIKKKTKDTMRKNMLRSPVIMMNSPFVLRRHREPKEPTLSFEHDHTWLTGLESLLHEYRARRTS